MFFRNTNICAIINNFMFGKKYQKFEELVAQPVELVEQEPIEEKILFIDWDDSLHPTNESFPQKLNKKVQQELDDFVDTVYLLLYRCIGRFKVYIITNGMKGWVENCIRTRMPRLAELMHRITIISAHELYGSQFTDSYQWKLHTFHNIMKDITKKTVVMSIGDSYNEIYALLANARYLQNSKIIPITIKLEAYPPLHYLHTELISLAHLITIMDFRSGHYNIYNNGSVTRKNTKLNFLSKYDYNA